MWLRSQYYEVRLWATLWLHKLKGGSYIDWYGDTLDSGARPADYIKNEMSDWIYDSGRIDLEAAKRNGLKPSHTLHEFGCGFLRSGHHFIRYLEKGNYSGNDAAGQRVARAREIFADLIAEKDVKLYVNRDNSLDWVSRKVDYVWCHAVFGHMPEDDIEEAIGNIRKIMHDKSIFLFSYDPPQGRHSGKLVYRQDARDWCHSLKFYARIAELNGMQVEDVSQTVRDFDGWHDHINLAKMTVKETGTT